MTMATWSLSALIATHKLVFCSTLNPFELHPPIGTNMAISAFVSAWNRLPRPHVTPCYLEPNHWHFALRTVFLWGPDTILFMVNPAGRYVRFECPPSMNLNLRHAPLQIKARVSALLLLKAFACEEGAWSRPWSWSTDCPEMARSVSMVMREFGVRHGLEIVEIAKPLGRKIFDEEWENFSFTLLNLKHAENAHHEME